MSEEDLGRVGRQDLLALCRHLRSELEQARKGRDEAAELARRQLVIEGCLSCRGGAEYKAMLANLTSVQERSSELLKETRVLRTALELMEKADDDSAEDCVARAREILEQAMKTEDVQALIGEECNLLKQMLVEKNRAYGNSALNPLRVFSKAEPEEQILVRLDDKLSRLARGSAAGEDVELDLMGYIVLLRVARKLRQRGLR